MEELSGKLGRLVMPGGGAGYNMPPEGVFHNPVIVSVQKRFPGHTRKDIHGWCIPYSRKHGMHRVF
jgi:3-polyprenyl-4-hydroxybenzoate decarboxylase